MKRITFWARFGIYHTLYVTLTPVTSKATWDQAATAEYEITKHSLT